MAMAAGKLNGLSQGKYQVIPVLSDEEYAELKTDIASRGVMVPVEYDEEGNILDGHARVQICQELTIKEWPRVIRAGLTEEQKIQHAYQINMLRRQVSVEWKKEEAKKLRLEGRSLRWIASALGVTEHAIRGWCSGATEVAPEQTTGKDNKSYPAKRAAEEELATRREKTTEMQGQGTTVRSIAKEMSVSIGTAASLVKKPDESLTGDEEQDKWLNERVYQQGMYAYCKYCYTVHNDWDSAPDAIAPAWECGECGYVTADEFMDIRDEPAEDYEPEGIEVKHH
jgi:ParB-like chromosome segregation protein Spo0J